MPNHEDSLGGETFRGEEQRDPAEQSLGDQSTFSDANVDDDDPHADRGEQSIGDEHTNADDSNPQSIGEQSTFGKVNVNDDAKVDRAEQSLGEQSTVGDANVDDELFGDGMELVDLSIRYTEEGSLGKGGFGEVVLATDTRLNRKVAIKRIQGKVRRSKTAVQRFLTEGQIIAGLSHSNVVQIFDYGWSTDGPYLIMEFVPGGSLLEKCKAGPIELGHAINIFTQLCDGLSKVHAASIIHRDIKPANVLITEDGVPKLTDFGLAKDDNGDIGKTKEGAVIGTLDFMPPEQRQAAELTDHRSDLWSLAATFYQMLTGEPPRVIDLDLVPPSIRPVLAKALKLKREDRFQSAMEMREAFLQAHSGKMDRSRTLAEGECPQCATPNPADQKFCRDCSAQLQVNCLGCQNEIKIWDNACGQCGSQQLPLVENALANLKETHDRAESLLADLEFDAATDEIALMTRETDSRLQHYAAWHDDFSTRLESLRTSEHVRLEGLLQETLTHEQAYDYEAGLQTLGQIAPSLRQTRVNGMSSHYGTAKELTVRLTTKQSRLKELEEVIRERVSKGDTAELPRIVNEFLALKPDHSGVLKLKVELEKRETKRLSQVQQEIEDTQNMQARRKAEKTTINNQVIFLKSLAAMMFVCITIGMMYSVWQDESWFRAISLCVLFPLVSYQAFRIYRRAMPK